MERDYFKETLPEFRTPRANGGLWQKDDVARHVTTWVCTLTNSLERDTWFFAVKVKHVGGELDGQEEVHFFLDERDAWLYRADRMGSKEVHWVSYERFINMQRKVVEEGEIKTMDFSARTLWDGYTLQEIRNLKV
jgi:hypothetical protein